MISQDDIDAMADTPHLVGITGRAGSGKSTAAQVLVDAGWVRIKMAGPLKDMLRAIGMTEAQIEGDEKETPCDLLQGQTPRHAMITLGTEWGRDMIGGDLWIGIARQRIEAALAARQNVVVDDVRFENEASVIRDLGGAVVHVDRETDLAVAHKSENGVVPDITCVNSGSRTAMQGWFTYVFLGRH